MSNAIQFVHDMTDTVAPSQNNYDKHNSVYTVRTQCRGARRGILDNQPRQDHTRPTNKDTPRYITVNIC